MSKKTSSLPRHAALKQPLRGIRVLVGRARHQASALSSQLREWGASVIEIPFIEIRPPRSFRPLDTALTNLASAVPGYDWLILTSVNGVDAMWNRMQRLKLATGSFENKFQIAAIGPATKKAIEARDLTVNVMPKEYVAESVVRSLKKKVKGKHVLLIRAKVARDVIPRELRKAGAHVDVVEAYETVAPESSRRRIQAVFADPGKRPHVVTFTSSSTVKNFVDLLGEKSPRDRRKMLAGIKTASIGPITSATLSELGLKVDVEAKEFTIPGLVAAIVQSTGKQRTG